MTETNHAAVKTRMMMNGITQFDVAKLMNLKSHATINQWLNGHKAMSPEFEERAAAAVALLERANAAAEKARSEVLAEYNL